MTLPSTFQFSQNSLQDFSDCPRRFQLRYLLHQPWPAVESEPLADFERLLERGQRFHQLVHRYTVGLPEAELVKLIDDPELRRWWRNYLESPPPDLPTAVRRSEVTLSAPLGSYRLVARYDLLALQPTQRAVVVDWKTNQKRPASNVLAARLQTQVYRYVLVKAGTVLNGGTPLSPDQVTMVYWFAEHPAQPEILPYDAASYTADTAHLTELVAHIDARAAGSEKVWPLTPDDRHCRFCTYRSLCDRGILPGRLAEFDVDQALEGSLGFEFEEIEEIEY
jgi:CRISPR/Cas system-associated exonuclease Cas4 (RecB family)